MKTDKVHNCRNDQKTKLDIEKFGLSVIIIERTYYLPSFAYSIGLWEKYKHPEIILFGFSSKTLHVIINDVGEFVKSGRTIETDKVYDDFFENGNAKFIKVDNRNLRDYFGYAIDFYNSSEFPALQLIWTNRNDKFPWEDDFEEEFVFKQPLLDRNADFKFREAKNLTVFTTRQWLEHRKPILRVVHDIDGDWQFLTGDQMPADIRIVALEELTLRDKTLNEVFNLEYGETAEREFSGGKWTRTVVEFDEEE